MVQPKLGDVLEPLKDDSNSRTPNPLFIHESNYESIEMEGNCNYYYDSDDECIAMPSEIIVDNVVTQHTTACCSMQVVDITLVKYHFTNITSLRVVQQKHSGLYSST
jgi:hypothetical protein